MSLATLESLWPGVEAAPPDDPGPLVVCADWCDANDKPALAYALRWCAGHEKRPYKRGDVIRFPWLWMRWQSRYAGISRRELGRRAAAIIHPCVYDESNSELYEVIYKNSLDAYSSLAVWLSNVRGAVEVPTIVLPPAPQVVASGPQVVASGPLACARCGVLRDRTVLDCPVCRPRGA